MEEMKNKKDESLAFGGKGVLERAETDELQIG